MDMRKGGSNPDMSREQLYHPTRSSSQGTAMLHSLNLVIALDGGGELHPTCDAGIVHNLHSLQLSLYLLLGEEEAGFS